MPTADCPTVELQRREVFGKAFTVDIVVVVSRTQCRSISRYFKSHGRIRLNLSQSDSLPDSLASHLQVTCLSCLRQSYHGGGGGGALGGGPAGGGPGGPGCSTGAGGGTSGGGGGAELISRTKAAGPMKAFIIRRDSKPRPSLIPDTRYQGTRMSEYVRICQNERFGYVWMYSDVFCKWKTVCNGCCNHCTVFGWLRF